MVLSILDERCRTLYVLMACNILSFLSIKCCCAHQSRRYDPHLSICPIHFQKVVSRSPPGRYALASARSTLHAVAVMKLLNFFAYTYSISCCYPLYLKSIQGSWSRRKFPSYFLS